MCKDRQELLHVVRKGTKMAIPTAPQLTGAFIHAVLYFHWTKEKSVKWDDLGLEKSVEKHWKTIWNRNQ